MKSTTDVDNPQGKESWWKSSAFHFLGLAAASQILLFTAVSILPAFFPLEAQKKGVNSLEVGLIVGLCFLACAALSLPWGYVTTKFSSKLQLIGSIIVIAVLTISYGFVDKIPTRMPYLLTCVTLRILLGLTLSICEVATYSMLPVILVGKESTGFAVMEMAVGLGYIIGPSVGGVLFDAGGFLLPFLGAGIPLFIVAALCYCFIKNPVITPTEEKISLLKLSLCPGIIIYSLVILSTETDFGFLVVTLEPTLAKYDLSHSAIGGIIMGSGAAYAITTPIWGHFCDKGGSAAIGSFVGNFICSVAFLFIGPVPWLEFSQRLWLIILTVIIIGLGVAAKMVCAFKMLLHSALTICGLPDNLVTYAAVSAIFTLTVSLGGFLGPLLGGFLLDNMGMRSGTEIMFYMEISLMIFQLLYTTVQKLRSHTGKVILDEKAKEYGATSNLNNQP